jgi:transglutaminase-like putative cysteine protease
LNATAAAGAVLAFFMGRDVIAEPYAWGFLSLLGVAFLIEWKHWPHPPRLLIDAASLAAFLAIFSRIRRDYIVEALMEALLLMTAVKMLEDKRARDYIQIAALGLVALVAYAMLSVEAAFIVYCCGMGIVLTLILILCSWFSRDEGALLSPRDLRQILGRALSLFGLMLPVCLLLFFLLPRAAAPLWSSRGQYGSVNSSGFSEQVRLDDSSGLKLSEKIAFRATAPLLPVRTLYWRGAVLDIFNDGVWMNSRNFRRADFVPDEGAPLIEQEIVVEAGNRGYLFALDHTLAVRGVDVFADGDGIFRYRAPYGGIGKRLRYQAFSALSPRMKAVDPGFSKRSYLLLPRAFIPRLQALTENLTRGKSDREKIEAIMAFLASPEFSYSIDRLPQGKNSLEEFIFAGKTGHCEFFASAMGVMLRMAGVPSRLVSGYWGGVYNDAGGYYIVSEQNAHVWVEAWDERTGSWTRHDPTPAVPLTEALLNPYSTWELYVDLLDYQWSKLVVNYSWETQTELAQNLWEAVRNPRASLSPSWDGLRRFGSGLSRPAAFLGFLVAAGAFFFALARAVRHAKNRRPEMTLLKKFQRAMQRHGYRRRESEGLEEFVSRVDDSRLHALASPFVREFGEFFYKDRPMNAAVLARLGEKAAAIARLKPSGPEPRKGA